jgi:hypothetical protein
MDPRSWLEKTRRELIALAPTAMEGEADAWRAAVLIARLQSNPQGIELPVDFGLRAHELVAVAGPPDPQTLLDDLADALDDEEDPAGPLHDVLLDVDDAVGVTSLIGDAGTAHELASRAAALVSLYPERVFELGAFADMRLGTLLPGAPIAAMWRAVEQAPATLLVEALPPVVVARTAAAARRPQQRQVSLPRHLLQAAASSSQSESIRLDIDSDELVAWLGLEKGRMDLEIRGKEAAPSRASLVAYDLTTDEVLAVEQLVLEVGRNTSNADLGTWAGSDNVLHRLVARTGRPVEGVDVRLRIDDD